MARKFVKKIMHVIFASGIAKIAIILQEIEYFKTKKSIVL